MLDEIRKPEEMKTKLETLETNTMKKRLLEESDEQETLERKK